MIQMLFSSACSACQQERIMNFSEGVLTGMLARRCIVMSSRSVCVDVVCCVSSSNSSDCCEAMMSSLLPKMPPRCDAKNSGVAACAKESSTQNF